MKYDRNKITDTNISTTLILLETNTGDSNGSFRETIFNFDELYIKFTHTSSVWNTRQIYVLNITFNIPFEIGQGETITFLNSTTYDASISDGLLVFYGVKRIASD